MGILSFFLYRRDRREAIDVEKRVAAAEGLGKPIWRTPWIIELAVRGGNGAIGRSLSSTPGPRPIQG